MAGDGDRADQRQALDHEGDGRLVDLGGGLDDADRHAHRQHRQQHRRTEQQRHLQAVGDLVKCDFGTHGSLPQTGLKLAASDPTTSTQPSTSTNSRILNGAEISIGESIIMPIDISTLATTRSMITNGM